MILSGVSASLRTFAGLLDRSVEEIAVLAADARAFDLSRIGRIADIWDNNTYPLVGAACALRPLRERRARAGLRWMADLGDARRALMVELDPSLDDVLPAAAPEPPAYRDYQQRVRPGTFPLTTEIVAGLLTDYDLAGASVRSLAVRPADTGLQVHVTLAAPRRFEPSTTCVMPDGSREPWPAAPLHFTFDGVTDMRFDADDRVGMALTCEDTGLVRRTQWTCGRARLARPALHESAAGRAASDATQTRSGELAHTSPTAGTSRVRAPCT